MLKMLNQVLRQIRGQVLGLSNFVYPIGGRTAIA